MPIHSSCSLFLFFFDDHENNFIAIIICIFNLIKKSKKNTKINESMCVFADNPIRQSLAFSLIFKLYFLKQFSIIPNKNMDFLSKILF